VFGLLKSAKRGDEIVLLIMLKKECSPVVFSKANHRFHSRPRYRHLRQRRHYLINYFFVHLLSLADNRIWQKMLDIQLVQPRLRKFSACYAV
jgi:hypothetical protein